MVMMSTKYLWLGAALVAFGVLTLAPATASAWMWDQTCTEVETYEVDNLPKPQAMIMLDKSGSMSSSTCANDQCHTCEITGGFLCPSGYRFVRSWARSNSDCSVAWCSVKYVGTQNCWVCRARWAAAVDAIKTLVSDKSDAINFGLGKFHNNNAYINLEWYQAQPNQLTAIANALTDSPGGGTPMAKGIDTMRTSDTVQDGDGGTAGILITDGVPSYYSYNGRSGRDAAVNEACRHRSDAPMYVIGFSSGTDESFNNLLAAAGGTGDCGYGDPCNCSGSQCTARSNWSSYESSCTGSYQANNQTQLQQALDDIANQVSCTFDAQTLSGQSAPLDWDDPVEGCANDYYRCLDIRVGPYQERVRHISDPVAGSRGWDFTNSEHKLIRFYDQSDGADKDFCSNIRDGLYENSAGDDIRIERACMCVKPTGSSCGGAGNMDDFCYRASPNCSNMPGTCECPQGTWSCMQGLDMCEGDDPCGTDLIGEGGTCTVGQGACKRDGPIVCDSLGGSPTCQATPGRPSPEQCDGTDNNCNGIVDDVDWDGDMCHVTASDMFDQDAIDDETMRCNLGVAGCFNGQEGCVPLEPMPEVCNGIDDDCTGMIDNLSTSWDANWVDENDDPLTLSSDYESAACYERNVCSCPRGRGDIAASDDFDDHLSTWANDTLPPQPTCVCGEGLDP
jgi:hypothetical protein